MLEWKFIAALVYRRLAIVQNMDFAAVKLVY